MSYTESDWRRSYDSKKTTFSDEQFVNNEHQSPDSHNLQTIQRKISKQKIAAEHRTEQSNGDHMFQSSHPYSTSSDPLRHSNGSRMLHEDQDIILANDFNHQAFHQPHSRKVTQIIPKENYSLSNSRPTQPRSTSASSGLPIKHESKTSTLTPSDIQRLKHVRRHEPAHVPSGPASKKSLITPDSWKSYPVVIKKHPAKKPTTEIVPKPPEVDEVPKPIVKQSSVPKKPRTDKPKRDTSASKPSATEQTPAKKPPKPEKTKEEKDKIQKYILEKRQEHEKNISHDKQSKMLQKKERKEKLSKLNEQIKKVAQQPLPPSLIQKSASTQLQPKDQTEQTRERLLHLLGPRITHEPPTEYHTNTPFIPERSSSSSSSSSESIVEIQPPKINQTITHSHSEAPIQNVQVVEQRHQNLLRWATNLARDCDNIETKFKYFRPDGTQPFDIIPASQQNPQHDDGNLRSQIPVLITNNNNTDPKPIIPSKILRPSGRLSHLNQNRTSEYQGQQLPGVGDLRDPALERRVKRDRAATKIQATYRGYTVRKSIHWLNDKQQRLNSEFNKRPAHKPTKISSRTTDYLDAPATKLDLRFSDDNFTIGSTLLRHYQRNGTAIIPSTTPSISDRPQQQKIQQPTTVQTYSDDYETITSTRSSTPITRKQIPEKPRVIQQPVPNKESTSSRTTSMSSTTSSSSSTTPIPTPQPPVPKNIQHRRSISPPLPPQMSPDNGRLVHHHPPPPPPPITTTSRRIFDERRYSPDALERQLNAELHLLDGVEASMQQVENMERLRSVALAQQEVVSLAQVLKNKPSTDTQSQQPIRKSTHRQMSSSSSSSQRRHSPSPHSRHRATQSTSSSSESILTAREKRFRQKFHNETELQAYEKRLKDVEKKIRLLVKRDGDANNDQQLEAILNASEIFDEKRKVASPRVPPKSSNESSISEDIPVSHKSSSTSSVVQQKKTHDTSEIRTETIEKDSDSSASSIHHHQSDTITTDASEIERRIRTYRDQLKTKKTELEKLKQRKNKDALKRQEDELKKQLQTYNREIETLRVQPTSPKVSTPSRKTPLKSSSSSSSSSTPTKPQVSSIAEDLPATSTTSQSKNNIIEKRVEEKRPIVKKERDFFDDDDDDDEEEEVKKRPELKPLETPRDERDTQHDAQSISTATDIVASSETDNDASRRPSTDNEKPILNLNTNLPSSLKSKTDSESSSSTTSEKSPKQQLPSQSIERKSSPIVNDYDEDFSEVSHSPSTPTKEPPPKTKVDEIDVESIQEDIEEKQSVHDTNHSLSSKSSGDEQSEILVLVKKSASTTPRRQEEKTLEEDFPPPPPPLVSTPEPKIESNNNDDTSHDVSEEEEEDVNEQENKIDKITDLVLRTFIDEAIDQGKVIERLKKENDQKKNVLTQEAKEWMSEEDLTEEDNAKQIDAEPNEFTIDLTGVGEKNPDEPRVESPRKSVIEEPVKPIVPHTRKQVIELCHDAIRILYEQNSDFSNRSTIRSKIPNSYFTYHEQDSDTDDVRRNRHAYCQMIFDLSVEILHEMDSENVQIASYPEWQKTKLVSKRFYRAKKPSNRLEREQFIQTKILEILNLNSRPITYSKWRVSNGQRHGIEKFETVLDEEIRRTESQWVNYEDDSIQIKFDIADLILDQLIQETLTDCFNVVDKRLFLSSNSTRL